MGDDSKPSSSLDAVKGIVQAIPVYQDAIQPAAKELGKSLETVAKAIGVALLPVSALVWGYEKIRDYLLPALAQRLAKTPEEHLQTPSPLVAGPALEGLRFAGHEPSLRELYANLLATSIDATTARDAHPAFVQILRELSPDEAKVIALFAARESFPLINLRIQVKDPEGQIERYRHFSLLGKDAACARPGLVPTYIENLCRLGLLEIPPLRYLVDSTLYEPLESDPDYKSLVAAVQQKDGQHLTERELLRITSMGRQFLRACVLLHESARPS
ncbi:MAG: DUF4393 domain-containing protein [Planctomycetes bacterium]|nr:DUF4393 domain-containing protein [Planctomycetota bacterium]